MIDYNAVHVGRSWVGHQLEDDCPCPKAPCGLVDLRFVAVDCPQHALSATKTMRQSHFAADCPAERSEASTASGVHDIDEEAAA